MRETLSQRQEEEVTTEEARLESTLPKIGRPTAEWLNLKTRKENLVKVKRYQEAHEINMQMADIERREHEKFRQHREAKIKAAIEKIRKRQKVECDTLEKRIKFGREEIKKERALQLERFIKRYNNAKKECSIQQALEKNKLVKKHNEGTGKLRLHTAAEQRFASELTSRLESARLSPALKKSKSQSGYK
jgi:hypothetical protein